MTQRLAALGAMTIEVRKEKEALAIARAFVARTRLACAGMASASDTKIEGASLVTFCLLLPECGGPQETVQAIENVCGLLIKPEALKTSYVNSYFNPDGSFFYNRVFDGRTDAFIVPGIAWFDIEISTDSEIQEGLRRLADTLKGAPSGAHP